MVKNSDYKVGEWVMRKHDGDIFVITEIYPDIYNPKCRLVKKFDGTFREQYLSHYSHTSDFVSLDHLYSKAPAAQVLYKNNNER